MKKTFRSILAGAVALLAVSCYDDSGLRDDIKKLDERVTALETTLNSEVASVNDLAAKLTAAQTAITNLQESVGTLGTDLAALKSTVNSILPRLDAVDGETDGKIANLEAAIAALEAADDEFDTELAEAIAKIAVTKVEEKGGNVVLTLATGGEVVLSKPMSNVDNNGLVTIVKDAEGVQHWAVVGADGTPEMLPFVVGAAGTIEFKVEEDNELKFTLNGQDWASTGAYVTSDDAYLLTDFYQGLTGEWDPETYEEIKDDFYTLVFGGVEYQLPLYKVDDSVIVIKAGKTTFSYDETKEFALDVKGISKFYVMTKPDGWKAVINNKTLVVTAPAQANPYAETEGEILLHANTADGKCKVAKLAVTTKFELTIAVDDATGKVDVTSALVMSGERYDPLEGVMVEYLSFSQIAIGMASIDLFEKDPEGYIAKLDDQPYTEVGMIGYLDNIYSNVFEEIFTYEPGVCDVAKYHGLNVADLYEMGMYEPLPRGSKLVVWAAPVNMETYEPDPAGLVYAYYSPVEGSIEAVGEPVFNEVDVNVSVYGADGYYVGKVAESYIIDGFTGEPNLKEYIANAFRYMNYGMNKLGMYIEEDGEYEYALSEIVSPDEMVSPLMPNTKYYAYVVPVTDGKAWPDYSYENDVLPYVKEFTTASLQPGGECSVELSLGDVTFTNISVNALPSEGTSQVYYKFYEPAQIDELGEGLVADLIASGNVAIESEPTMRESVELPGAQRTLVAVAVDSEGRYGEVVLLPVESKAIEYSKTFKASVGEVSFEANGINFNVTVPVTVEGGTAAKYYYYWNNRIRDVEEIKQKLPMGEYPYSSASSLPANYVFYSSVSAYQFAVVVESETGELSEPIIMTINKPVVE